MVLALAGISFTVAICSHLQTHGKSLKDRLASFKSNPELFRRIDRTLARAIASAAQISVIFRDRPETLPEKTRDLAPGGLVSVNEALVGMTRKFEPLCWASYCSGCYWQVRCRGGQ